jgi:hypothetical protein
VPTTPAGLAAWSKFLRDDAAIAGGFNQEDQAVILETVTKFAA